MSCRVAVDRSLSSPQLQLPLERNELERKYREWRDRNPQAFEIFRRSARYFAKHGRPFGIGLLTEWVRWENRRTWDKDSEGFKLNNNFRAYIARDLILEMPEMQKLLEVRQVKELA